VLAGQKLGIQEIDEGIWLVSFMHYELGYFEPGAKNLATTRQPVRHEAVACVFYVPLPMSPDRTIGIMVAGSATYVPPGRICQSF
jgi:hypothetical protein